MKCPQAYSWKKYSENFTAASILAIDPASDALPVNA
jgi:hypothetical protein